VGNGTDRVGGNSMGALCTRFTLVYIYIYINVMFEHGHHACFMYFLWLVCEWEIFFNMFEGL
jgi:hypothetical protein